MVASKLIRGPEIAEKLAQRRVLTIPESLGVLVDGFQHGFQNRTYPSTLSGVSFVRVAGQAICLSESVARLEVKHILDKIVPGGAFLILGHGGLTKCGAVGAKQAELALPTGEHLNEPRSVNHLLEHISPNVARMHSPEAEFENARFQAEIICSDQEFKSIIDRKNITIVYTVWTGEEALHFTAFNRDIANGDILEYHPKLGALSAQMAKGARKLAENGGNGSLQSHYAHSAVAYDPTDLRRVLDPHSLALEVGGICCVDARLTPNTPDGPKYLFKQGPNSLFAVTVVLGGSRLTVEDSCSLPYAYGHVLGINSLAHDGERGSGHTVALTTDITLDASRLIESDLCEHHKILEATANGAAISLVGFNGRTLRVFNKAHGIDESFVYQPQVNILSL
ncbi:MAG: hypothetical protein ABID61_03085 [Candidatus Micrarchaeota archaeon]